MNPMQEKMEEWKKNVVQLDKDHAKGKSLFTFSVNVYVFVCIKFRIVPIVTKVQT